MTIVLVFQFFINKQQTNIYTNSIFFNTLTGNVTICIHTQEISSTMPMHSNRYTSKFICLSPMYANRYTEKYAVIMLNWIHEKNYLHASMSIWILYFHISFVNFSFCEFKDAEWKILLWNVFELDNIRSHSEQIFAMIYLIFFYTFENNSESFIYTLYIVLALVC